MMNRFLACVLTGVVLAAILCGFAPPVHALCAPGGGPAPVATDYVSFYGAPLRLFAWDGRRVSVLTPTDDLCPATMGRMLEVLDGAYDFYAIATGRDPAPWPPTMHAGRSTIAVVPSTCGAGCGYVGFTGIEILPDYFQALYDGIAQRDDFDQVLFYELGRNFWFYGTKIDYPAEGSLPEMGYATPYAILMRFLSMDAVGVRMADDRDRTSDTIRSQIRGLVDRYVGDPSATWQDAVRTASRPDLHLPYSHEDFKASFLWRLESLSCTSFSTRFWREVGARPDRTSTTSAADNLFVAASRSAGTNLARVFGDLWGFPISQQAKSQVAAQLGAAIDPEPYAVPEIARDVLVAPIGTIQSEAASVALRSDGGMVLGGWSQSGEESFSLAAFTPEGRLDGTFGYAGTGIVGTVIGSQGSRIESIAVDGADRIVAAGWSRSGPEYFTIARYTRSGALDPTFGVNSIPGVSGHLVGTNGGRLHAVALQPDGKIVAAGYSSSGPDYLTVVRYLPDGRLDTTFGGLNAIPGVTGFLANGEGGRLNAVAIQPNGRIVVAGYVGNPGREAFVVARLLRNGMLDTTFGGVGAQPGVVRTPLGTHGGRARAIALQADGKIVVAGHSDSGPDYVEVVRYDARGVLDPTFGVLGSGVRGFGVGNLSSRGTAVALQSNGKIVVAGSTVNPCGTIDMAIARLLPDGSLDGSFGRDGRSGLHLGGGAGVRGLVVSRDGKIVAAGSGGNAGAADFTAARIGGDEPIAPTISSEPRAKARRGRPFTYRITATGHPSRFASSTLPSGLSLNAVTGEISGVPQTRGKFRVQILAINEYGTGRSNVKIKVR